MRPLLAPCLIALLTALPVAATAANLKVKVDGIAGNNAPIAPKYALCKATADGKSTGGENVRPTISWRNAPAATKSFAIVVTDPDVPADFTDAGKEGKVVQANAERQTFYHWALADIPATVTRIPGGPSHKAPEMGTPIAGSLEKYVDNPTQYGGPCPPWNDERVHHYHFTVYALDVPSLQLTESPTAKEVEESLQTHRLASGAVTGTYTLNRTLR